MDCSTALARHYRKLIFRNELMNAGWVNVQKYWLATARLWNKAFLVRGTAQQKKPRFCFPPILSLARSASVLPAQHLPAPLPRGLPPAAVDAVPRGERLDGRLHLLHLVLHLRRKR